MKIFRLILVIGLLAALASAQGTHTGGGGGGGGTGASTFDQLGSGTNGTATMTCGTGCTVTNSGSGTVNATFAPQNTLTGDVTTTGGGGTSTTLAAIAGSGLTITSPAAGDVICYLTASTTGNCPLGVVPNAQTGASYTVLTGDRNKYLTFSNAGGIAVTLPQAGTAGFASNFHFAARNIGVGSVTITPGGATTINGAANLVLATGEFAFIYSDNTNYFAAPAAGPLVQGTGITITKNAAGPTIALTTPVTVANGGTNLASGTSGGILGYTGTTTLASSVLLSSNVLIKGGGAAATPTNSSITDNGTTVSTAENIVTTGNVQTGSSPPTCTAGSGGAFCATEGTAPTAAASVDQTYGDSTLHDLAVCANGGCSSIVHHTAAKIHQTAQTAAITTATLCAATAGLCNQAGQYHVHFDFWGSGTACSSVTAGSVTFLLTWTDANAVVHAAVALQMMGQTGAATEAMASSFPFQTALANESASGDFNVSTNGAIIQYATGYTACTTGTGTYNLDAAVTRVQ